MKWDNPKFEELCEALLSLNSKDEFRRFLRDLMTEDEIIEFTKRWQVAQMLDEGIPYTTIQDKTGLSSTTVARISFWLRNGMGGYRLVLDRNLSSSVHHTSPSREKRPV